MRTAHETSRPENAPWPSVNPPSEAACGRLRVEIPVVAPSTGRGYGGIVASPSCPTGGVRGALTPAFYSTRSRPQAASDGGIHGGPRRFFGWNIRLRPTVSSPTLLRLLPWANDRIRSDHMGPSRRGALDESTSTPVLAFWIFCTNYGQRLYSGRLCLYRPNQQTPRRLHDEGFVTVWNTNVRRSNTFRIRPGAACVRTYILRSISVRCSFGSALR